MYREVQQLYDRELGEDRGRRDARVASLEAAARQCVGSAALEVARLRADAARRANAVVEEADARVREIEQERLKQIADHHHRLREIEERIEANRLEGEGKICAIEKETQAIFVEGEGEVARLAALRETECRAARACAADAESVADTRCPEAAASGRAALAQARVAVADIDTRCAQSVDLVEKTCDVSCRDAEAAAADVPAEAAARIEALLDEMTKRKTQVEEMRDCCEQHLFITLDAKRNEVDKARERALEVLEDTHHQARKAHAESKEADAQAVKAGERHARVELDALVSELESRIHALTHGERLVNKEYARDLEELAHSLRAGHGGSRRGPQPPKYVAEAARRAGPRQEMTIV